MVLPFEELATFRAPVTVSEGTDRICTFSNRMQNLASIPGRPIVPFVASALALIGCEEALPMRWNLDNPLIQSLVFERYLPLLIPKTIGLGQLFCEAGDSSLRSHLLDLFPGGYVLHGIVGSGDGQHLTLIRADEEELIRHRTDILNEFSGDPATERFFLRSKQATISEYRVHTLKRSVISTLILRKDGSRLTFNDPERYEVQKLVQQAFDDLPDALCSGLSEWHISLNACFQFELERVNFAGFKTFENRHFKCSQDLDNPQNAALLLHFISTTLGVVFEFQFEPCETIVELELAETIYRMKCWKSLLEVSDEVFKLFGDTRTKSSPRQASTRELIAKNKATVSDRDYIGYLNIMTRATDDLR
jgi:hypothetical protein